MPIINNEKREKQRQQTAEFRFSLVGELLNPYLTDRERKKLIKDKASRHYVIPKSDKNSITVQTIRSWMNKYKLFGMEGLLPRQREDRGHSRNLANDDANKILDFIKTNPGWTATSTVRKLYEDGLIKTEIKNSALSRLMKANGLTQKQRAEIIDNKKNEHCFAQIDKDWMNRLLLGQISEKELSQELFPSLPKDDINKLLVCIFNNRLRYRKRAIVLLAHYKGIPIKTISDFLYITESTVLKTLESYNEAGVVKIISDQRTGLHKHQQKEYIEKIFSILHAPPSTYGYNRTTWRQSDIKKVMEKEGLPISKGGLAQILTDAGYNYKKARTVLTSNDPDYKEKLEIITKILSNLKPSQKFFSIDEYGSFAIEIQGGRSLVPPGTVKTVPQWQKSKGSLIMTAALELSTNQITHFYSEKKNTDEMIKLLNILIEKYSKEETIFFSWDTASWHASKKLYETVDTINSDEYRKKNIVPYVELAPLPSCAQFLNVIESVFSGMARAIIHNSNYKSVGECKNAIDKYIEERNEQFLNNPKRAGNKIWGKERVPPEFSESNNCKDPAYS